MAWTQDDVDALDAKYGGSKGVRSVRFADGRQIDFSSYEEYLKIRNMMLAEVNSNSGTSYASRRTSYASFSKE